MNQAARGFVSRTLAVGMLVAAVTLHGADSGPNLLLIAIDDLNDYVGCLDGHPNAITPNLDRLAARGVLFTHAYCNSPVCQPSRTSLWTGLRPTTVGITANRSKWFRESSLRPDCVSLPQAMASAGYSTLGFGKLFHVGRSSESAVEWQRSNVFSYGPRQKPKLHYDHGDSITDWGVPPKDRDQAASFDPIIADRTIAALSDLHSRPLFLGCGFYRPHTPLYAASKWFDLHPKSGIALPRILPEDNDDLVYFGRRPRRPQDIEAPGLFNQDWAEQSGKWKDVLRAYLACTTAMDHQLGRVLDALDRGPHAKNTYVILFSDHGWHLGEKRHWGKAALWEQTTRVPMIVAGPGIPDGVRYDQPIDLLTITPTVLDYAGVTPPHKLDGHSLRPVLENVKCEWPHPVLTTFVDHHALRTPRWRYIRYASGEEELYDHARDSEEFENLAVTRQDDAVVRSTLIELRKQMSDLLSP
ncbi:sulfatase [Crateriforma conspicua]|uniref:Choline-sulfatase n=1 Tax=Crateriforma conspicua TaxID=2527996 RepID=A0A5C5YAC0_9PLAN|nr:sulfatase [Crateriforma conspicua]TWT71401.1 Choline-sulfatase [Crateriforma conspicua]